MNKLRSLAVLIFFHHAAASMLLAQQPPEKLPLEIELTKFRVEPLAAPGGTKPWLRLLCDFKVAPAWADGIVFHYDVLVRKGEESRVLSGTARYTNVKRGAHTAVLYMSAGAFERFGAPIAANVRSIYKDEPSGEIAWVASGGGKPPENWMTQFQRYPSQLLPIIATPFVVSEYGKYPDVLVVQ
jgi:hypothetical protein